MLHQYVENHPVADDGTDFDPDYFVPSQWAHVLNLELESDLAPDGIGPFELISAFARIELRTPTRFGSTVLLMLRISPFTRWRDHPSVRIVSERVAAPPRRGDA